MNWIKGGLWLVLGKAKSSLDYHGSIAVAHFYKWVKAHNALCKLASVRVRLEKVYNKCQQSIHSMVSKPYNPI
jgi:hypothetical protein